VSAVSAPARRRAPRLPAGFADRAVTLDRVGAGIVVGLAAVFAAVSFVTQGGAVLPREAPTEIALLAGGGVLAGVALLRPSEASRGWGATALWLFAAFAALTAVSIGWSVAPNDSWLEANRTLAYLACFAGGVALARLAPDRVTAVVGAVLLGALVVAGYALATKLLPRELAADELFARLRAPYGYWNATGLIGALGVPAALWFGSRRGGHPALSALAWPATAILLSVVLLAYSRGSLLALGAGLALWFACVPLRLRGAAVLAGGGVGAGVIAAWSFTTDALSLDVVGAGTRELAGQRFGMLVAVVLLALLLVGLAANALRDREPLSPRLRRRAGTVLVALVALAAVGGVAAVAASPGGIPHAVRKFTDPNASIPKNTPNRLTQAGSIRALYWKFGYQVWEGHKLEGTGVGGFASAHTRLTRGNAVSVTHAHGWLPQTAADLGLIGLLVSLALLIAWARAALRAAPLRRRRGTDDAQRAATLTLLATVVVFGVHGLVDWTWFIPGVAVPALVAAGWLAGRGPLSRTRADDGPRRAPSRVRYAAVVGLAALVLVGAYAISRPLRASERTDDALAAIDAGKVEQARKDARAAADLDPLTPEPLWALATADVVAGDEAGAREQFTKAVRLVPSSSDAWTRLGTFELDVANNPGAAVRALGAALRVDPESPTVERAYVRARRTYLARQGRNSAVTP
jgi:tetratricopeptide (TPR) repeat protein